LKQFIFSAGLPENVRIESGDSHNDYQRHLQRVDVALGTLALSRSGRNEATPLKTGDYVSSGIPIMLPYSDPRLKECADKMLLMDADLDGCHEDIALRLGSFVPGAVGKRLLNGTRERVSTVSLERRRIDFLRSLLDD
jgi:hypothetical protein